MSAKFTQLRTGEWGIKVDGEVPAKGRVITVTHKSGKTENVTVGRVVWHNDKVSICTVEKREPYRGNHA